MSEEKKIIIKQLSWGEIELKVNGESRNFRDCKIWPGGAREWDWDETGTSHSPGIQIADVEEILDKEVEVIILSRGQQRRLQVMQETQDYLDQQDITYHIEETNQAVDHFNELSRAGKRVGGVFHTTC